MTQPLLDRPEVSQVLFYPRRAYGLASALAGARSIGVQVEPGIVLGGQLYPATPDSPALLFFHGNGEIAEDYDDIAPVYTQLGITLLRVNVILDELEKHMTFIFRNTQGAAVRGSYLTLSQAVYVTPRTQGPLFAFPRTRANHA